MTTSKSPKSEILAYQTTLQRGGFYFGKLDGIWGPVTQRAHESYSASLLPGIKPTSSALKAIQAQIVATANRFRNLTETSNNARWDDLKTLGADPTAAELRAALIATAWQPGWAYCCAFAEVCWRAGYQGRAELALISQAITASCMGTYDHFAELGRVSKVPTVGAIGLYQKGNTYFGHAFIVTGLISSTRVLTVQGNTSSNTEDRDGDGVYEKPVTLDFTKKSGLWLKGFVNPFLVG